MSGPSGSGKTTLLTLIGGLRTLQEGEIEVWDGDRGDYRKLRGTPEPELVNVRRLIGFIFQRHNLFDSLTAMQNVRMAQRLKPRDTDPDADARDLLNTCSSAIATSRASRRSRASTTSRRRSPAGSGSGVAIARALVNRPKLVLADEPTAALDANTGLAVVTLLQDLARDRPETELQRLVRHRRRGRRERPARRVADSALLKAIADRDRHDEPDRHARRPHHEPRRPHRSHGARADRVERRRRGAALRARWPAAEPAVRGHPARGAAEDRR